MYISMCISSPSFIDLKGYHSSRSFSRNGLSTAFPQRCYQLLRPCFTDVTHVQPVCRDQGKRVQKIRERQSVSNNLRR